MNEQRKNMRSSITEPQKRKIIALIHAIIPNAKIILFGSQARGTQFVESDIDIAVDTGRALKIDALGELMGVLEGTNLPYSIDIVDLHTVSDAMQTSIKQEGIIWIN